jgi:hypothetical protein
MKTKKLNDLVKEIFEGRPLPIPRKVLIDFLVRVYEAGYGDADVHEESAKVGAVIAYLVAIRDLDVWAYYSVYGKGRRGLRIMVGFEDEDELMFHFDLPELMDRLFNNEMAYEVEELEEVVTLLRKIADNGERIIQKILAKAKKE